MARFDRTVGVLALGLALSMAGPNASAETLQQALETAYMNNPQLGAERQSAATAQERLAQARAQWRPQVTLSGSYGYDSSESTRAFASNIGNRPSASAQLQAVVPVYAGGRIEAGIRQAKAGIGAANAQLDSTGQDLLLQVITTYVDVLRDRETIKIRQSSVVLLEEQVQAARDRFEVGEVTRTDVAQSEARLEGARAALAAAESALQDSEAVYEFLIGVPAGDLTPAPPAPLLPSSVEEAVEIGLGQNPNIEALRFNERAASEAVTSAYGALKPTVSIVGSASVQETYVNDFRDTTMSATARASIPLFEGGLTRSQVRSAKLQREQARLRTDNAERQVRAQVAQGWFSHVAALKAIEASERQVEAAEIAFSGVQEELAVGVRTTLDVLDQEQQLLEARLNLIRSQRDAYVAAHQLLRAMGALGLDRLDLGVAAYDPQDYGDKVRRNWLLTDTE